ncbi:MAG: tRNA (guanosine(46)-N7)-methyltransferase TrmB [Patescibacteria group bacterium]|jgi:tRNA (guanine-N7-)-methyltransferase
MSRQKLNHIIACSKLPNVITRPPDPRPFPLSPFPKGQGENYSPFRGLGDLVLELACGKAAYTLALAKLYPEQYFIGVDRKRDRIYRAATLALEQKLTNVSFIATDIERLPDFIPDHSVNEIWITFPDPLLKPRQAKHRLTNPNYLLLYQRLLKPIGCIHLKTDSVELFNAAIINIKALHGTIITSTNNVDSIINTDPRLQIITDYEQRWRKQGKLIYYLVSKIHNPSICGVRGKKLNNFSDFTE